MKSDFDVDADVLKHIERLDRQRDAEATIRRGIYERTKSDRIRSEEFWQSFNCWASVAVILGLFVLL